MSFPLVTLVILDGFGLAPPGPGNAVELAHTPVFDDLVARYPHTELAASGGAVGLPDGQMGNSEVGHLTIGSGRILYQDLVRVGQAVADGSLATNPELVGAFERARARGGAVHLLGLVSTGGVHSHLDHLLGLIELAAAQGMGEATWVHAFTDGRDVSPTAAVADLPRVRSRLATVVGRYYAMDRDKRWERTARALDAILHGVGDETDDPVAAVRAGYGRGTTDEFVEPITVAGTPRLDPVKDTAIFFNFRPDRGRQLAAKLIEAGVDLVTMTRYSDELDCPIAFPEQTVGDTLAEVVSRTGKTQLHAAETEKYAHVTYFFNGGIEEPWPGEERILVASPRDVPSYDHAPAMSAPEVATRVCDALAGAPFAFCVVNFANPDMVGHTGVIPAVVEAIETVDECLGRIVEATHRRGGVCLVTADHGNAEKMLADDGISPFTAHTTNPVPLVLTSTDCSLRPHGELRDLAPTILALLGVPIPAVMTGTPLVTENR